MLVHKRFFLVEYVEEVLLITLDQEKPFLDQYLRFQINEPLLTTFYTNLHQNHNNTKVHI